MILTINYSVTYNRDIKYIHTLTSVLSPIPNYCPISIESKAIQ